MFGFLFVVLILRLISPKLLSGAIDGGHVFVQSPFVNFWLGSYRKDALRLIQSEKRSFKAEKDINAEKDSQGTEYDG